MVKVCISYQIWAVPRQRWVVENGRRMGAISYSKGPVMAAQTFGRHQRALVFYTTPCPLPHHLRTDHCHAVNQPRAAMGKRSSPDVQSYEESWSATTVDRNNLFPSSTASRQWT